MLRNAIMIELYAAGIALIAAENIESTDDLVRQQAKELRYELMDSGVLHVHHRTSVTKMWATWIYSGPFTIYQKPDGEPPVSVAD